MLVANFDDNLRVVELLLLRLDREPEPGTATTDKSCERFQNILLMVFVSEAFGFLPDDGFCPLGNRVCRTERSIWREPDIHIRQVREVLGEELRLQHFGEHSAQHQDDEGADKNAPAVS